MPPSRRVALNLVDLAQRIAEDVLFPAALATDSASVLPVELLDALADAGFYGLTGPRSAGGAEADFRTACGVVEAISSGCLTTAFVWAQHIGAVIAAASSENPAIAEWVAPLCRGHRRAGLALGGALPGPPALRATASGSGWVFSGTSPFVSGWDRIDVIHTAARADDGRLIWALVDARESDSLTVRRLDLVALNATNTVRAELHDHPVSTERVTSVAPFGEGPPPPELLRIHASFGLGLVRQCCRLLGSTPLDDELSSVRAELDRLDPATIQRARGSIGGLALRAAGALAVASGSRSLLTSEHAQRLVREALFVLVYALRPGSREAALADLGAKGPSFCPVSKM
jgi:alkylation response protein AidB-like acyl-CoA dehydrogenase